MDLRRLVAPKLARQKILNARHSCKRRYVAPVAITVSIDELRDSTASVISRLEAGEALVLTVDRRPIADLVPWTRARDPWLGAAELRKIVADAPGDPDLLNDLSSVRDIALDDDE
jgi:antitoxin (DNA-binding transcriptional repressor) of toxin-antitoxin stability system